MVRQDRYKDRKKTVLKTGHGRHVAGVLKCSEQPWVCEQHDVAVDVSVTLLLSGARLTSMSVRSEPNVPSSKQHHNRGPGAFSSRDGELIRVPSDTV
eukprot:m.231218 g.231218  ORF g.231218 m.231218 type:complete len:97 (-) comp15687_c0_seq9:349-639(-)